MSGSDVGFFIAAIFAFFGVALAVQMRFIAGLALKRAAMAKFPELEDGPARFAVAAAAHGKALETGDAAGDAAAWLAAEYPRAISHIRIARKAMMVMGGVLLVILVAWRFTGGEG